MGKLDNGKANLHMYCLQGNLRPFLKPFSIFCLWENKTDFKPPPPSKKENQQQKNLKKQPKKPKNKKLVQINESLCSLLCLGKFNTE